MYENTVSPNLAIVKFLASLEAGWASSADMAFAYGADDHRPVKSCLAQLYHLGLVERLYVRHRDQPLCCYKLDSERLHRWLEEQES